MTKKLCSFVLFGQTWKVVLTDRLDQNVQGLCIYEKRLIKIKNDLPPQFFQKVLLHELLHAALYRASFYVTGIAPEAEELIVDQLAQMLIDNNRTLRRFIK